MRRMSALVVVLMLSGFAFAQPSAIDLGTLTGDVQVTGSIAPNEIVWYTFNLPGDALMADGTYLDIDSNDSGFDTEIGLYDDIGLLVDDNDDDGFGLQSVLTFGSGSELELGDPFNLGGNGIAEGENGDLSAGVYYVGLGEFNVDWGETDWGAVSTGTDTGGEYVLTLRTNIPEPASLLLLGFGLLLRRR